MHDSVFDVSGRIALVTGSSRGLGFTLARGLAQSGATVVLNGRNEDRLSAAVRTLTEEGYAAHGMAFDILDAEKIRDSVRRIDSELGPIAILVNNAGTQIRGPLEDFSEEDWRAILDTNLTGVFLVSREVARGMISRKAGKIINICSLQSEVGRPTIAPYAASKGGLKMFTKAMALEWGKHNIQVNGIGPGYFITEMTQNLADDPKFNSWICGRTPAGRWGKPEELVGTLIYLASAASGFVNGQIIYVDGGVLTGL